MRIMILSSLVPFTFLYLDACAPSYPHNTMLEAELEERSRNEGLGILSTTATSGPFPVMYFDRSVKLVNCCPKLTSSWVISGGRELITLDWSRVIHPMDLASWGPNAIIFDLNGVEQRRLNCWLHASFVAMSRDGEMIAFRGLGGQPPASGGRPDRGLLIGRTTGAVFHKIYSLPEDGDPETIGNKRAGTFAWSPKGDELAYGKDDAVFVYNLREDTSRFLAKGSNPLWSPSGSWISYRGPNGEAMLVDPSGKSREQLLAGRKINHALHWSPDNRYLLLTLISDADAGAHWAQMMIYRLSDAAITPIGEPGLGSLDDAGREWVVTGSRH